MRLHVHGIGVCGVGVDSPAGTATARLADVPIKDYARPAERRRFGRLAKLMYVAASRALADAGVADPSQLAVVAGTALGEPAVSLEMLAQIHASAGRTLSPALAPNSVHSSPAGYLTIGLKNRMPALTVSQGWLSAEAALSAAAELLDRDDAPMALVVCGDEADPEWEARLAAAGAPGLAAALAAEAFQEGAVALVVGCEPGGRKLGALAAGVVRPGPKAADLRGLLERSGALPPPDANVRLRHQAGGAAFAPLAAVALGRDPSSLVVDGPGPGSSQAGALAALTAHLTRSPRGELLLLGREIDEVGFLRYVPLTS
ncbi:MAG: beta-ketoacyl synthase chain length factor [Deltaproteobacteria bacterium]|nr:beta-ketoacyl synthase chain length factor [Deltaproteobacteria bacterium]